MDKDEKIKELKEENNILKEELLQTKEHLKKYTSPLRSKIFYENHKEKIKQNVKEYKKKTNYVVSPEKLKETNRKAYLKRKEKLKKELEEPKNDNENI
jgi:hypothetical protein